MIPGDDARPLPESLLPAARAEEGHGKRGRLKIFLGAAPGVGKTWTMLEAALARMREGVDVLAGVVVTHGRVETTALARRVPALPPVLREHRGLKLEEFDLDGALAREPALLLIDELAHTNAPGSRHVKRWQDVEELLAAGIDVSTTLNVQHLESVHDVVERLTGVPVRERVPDEFVDAADEVELVDLPTEELLARLRSGRVYLGEQAVRAEAGFFRPVTLARLRELALRLVADRVRATAPGPAAAGTAEVGGSRLLVCIGASPFTPRLLRSARRLAESMNVDWLALHVQEGSGALHTENERRRLGRHAALAEQLGAEVHTVTGRDRVGEIIAFARRHGVRRIVVGKPLAPRWRDLLSGSLVWDLVRRSGDIDVDVVNGELAEDPETEVRRRTPVDWRGYAFALASVAAATSVCWLLRDRLARVNLSMIYLLAVVAVALRGSRGPAAVASLLGVAAFDFLFVLPYFSFTVDDPQYLLTFAVMLLAGLVISSLSARLRAEVDAALRTANASAALHRLGRDLATTRGTEALAAAAQRRCGEILGGEVEILVRDERDGAERFFAAGKSGTTPRPDELAVARWVFENRQAAGPGTGTLPGASGLFLPLIGAQQTVGVLVCRGVLADRVTDPEERRLFDSLAQLVGLALECDRLAAAARDAEVAIASERLRNALLSSVSHDLRTPLAIITGSASALAETQGVLDPMTRAELARGIADEAESLNRVVTNLLDVTRLESGAVKLRTAPHAVEDLLGTALAAMSRRLAAHPTTVTVAADCPPVAVDDVLFQSVLVNLLENAVSHTPAGTPVELSAGATPSGVEIRVADRGPGLDPAETERIFEKFVRSSTGAAQRGVGLGLTICKRIVEAHGGTIRAASRAGGGAEFVITLPAHRPKGDG